jgi:hypothetical protein
MQRDGVQKRTTLRVRFPVSFYVTDTTWGVPAARAVSPAVLHMRRQARSNASMETPHPAALNREALSLKPYIYRHFYRFMDSAAAASLAMISTIFAATRARIGSPRHYFYGHLYKRCFSELRWYRCHS